MRPGIVVETYESTVSLVPSGMPSLYFPVSTPLASADQTVVPRPCRRYLRRCQLGIVLPLPNPTPSPTLSPHLSLPTTHTTNREMTTVSDHSFHHHSACFWTWRRQQNPAGAGISVVPRP